MSNALVLTVAGAALAAGAATLGAQGAAELIAAGDREHAAANAVRAFSHYQAAVRAEPANAEAFWRAAAEAVDLGEFSSSLQDSLYRLGEIYGRRAVAANPRSAMAHFALAKALGRRALSLGVKDRVKFAGEVRKEALEALALDSTNVGALHVMGRWHASIMRLSGMSRFVAKNVLGGKTFDEASWEHAIAYLERAAALEPDRIVHQLELASIYADSGNKAKARETYRSALALKPVEFNDKHYLQLAERQLRDLR